MGVSSRTEVKPLIYRKGDKKDIANYRSTSLLNLHYINYTAIVKNCMQETLDGIIGENKSTAIEKRTMLHALSIIRDIIHMSNTLNKQLAAISLDFFSQGGLGFYFLCPSYV